MLPLSPTDTTEPVAVPNHAFVVDYAMANRAGGAMLDFGCGAGGAVEAARRAGLRAFGVDCFNRRNDSLRTIAARGRGGSICIMDDRHIPFRDATFDLVVSNQVFEHVHDLDGVLAEIRRVLKPDGVLLALFPSDEVWREGHCGVPFVHWLGRNSRLRVPYMLAARRIGLGAKKDDRPFRQWALDHLEYIDDYTIYRPSGVIEAAFARHIGSVIHIEAAYCHYRLLRLGSATAARLSAAPLMQHVTEWLCRKLASMVIVARRAA